MIFWRLSRWHSLFSSSACSKLLAIKFAVYLPLKKNSCKFIARKKLQMFLIASYDWDFWAMSGFAIDHWTWCWKANKRNSSKRSCKFGICTMMKTNFGEKKRWLIIASKWFWMVQEVLNPSNCKFFIPLCKAVRFVDEATHTVVHCWASIKNHSQWWKKGNERREWSLWDMKVSLSDED